MRNTMQNWMLGTALIAGVFGMGAVGANAQVREFHRGPVYGGHFYGRGYYRPGFQVGVTVGAPVVADTYIPPCPGEGYVWNDGYYEAGVWVPGTWVYQGGYAAGGYVTNGYAVNGYYGDRHFDRDRDFDRRRDFDRHDRDFDRGDNRGYDRGAGRGFGDRR